MTTETEAQRVARENDERWIPVEVSDVARSRRVLVAAYSCTRCGAMYAITDRRSEADTQRRAETCCGPWECRGCGKPYVQDGKYRHFAPSWCGTCGDRKQRERYNSLPLADEGYNGPIAYDEEFFCDLESFLESCDANDRDDPYSVQPETCEPVALKGLDLAEHIAERAELSDGYDLSFLAPVQQALDEAIKAHNAAGPNWWVPNGKRPRIPENWRADFATP